ncbi:glutathionyl-hydroquinone reductase YqjG [Pandoraea morbifera]|uniref:Glutathionyl-hydroquinone reductase YqjG n=1 Tax=Pandoraea morbifera TaxID=2508300 RepID=A0A5E4Y161_9BURK|nr:glutathione S-transferase family protein [Pandoraea morbifera]VVE42330.1 glutathionyl-hydroquinone reductase YqjG [Pandoraea morbifera]
MGLLIDGEWHTDWYDTRATGGRFERRPATFRHWVTSDGAPGPSGDGGFAARRGRYLLYVSYACPWAHRTLIMRALKGLQDMVPVAVVNWLMLDDGWTFKPGPDVTGDPVGDARFLRDVYLAADRQFTGRVTVPVLWDTERRTIVSNESSEILRMFNSAFDGLGAIPGDYYPVALREEIDMLNARIYDTVNNGVYKAGFATTQAAYEEAVTPLFDTLDMLDARLATRRFLAGERMTEADIRLFTTLIRFDAVYVGHFKCNVRRIVDYPNLNAYTRDIYQQPGVAATVNFQHIKGHYYESHRTINPTGIVPLGPRLDLDAPHDRGQMITLPQP